MENNFGKIGVVAGLSTFVLLIVGIRNVLGQPIEILNFVAFSVFGLIIGIIVASILFYKLKIAFYMFSSFLLIALLEMFRSFIVNANGQGDLIGILSLFIITSFGLGLSLIVQFIVILLNKKKNAN
ncbi:hypothetical protein JSQ81_04545 [Sporosarcina sp. Marseille-Q4063]|uniref:hypothetical protein n=1 Tax=Sporosarcina sp. Marseille-Q4063 TaxID=2810514 RepID=UPI001BAFBBAC|nr:hypothetical protein [Sporosarcina sp. Marseille-Q4063]QUW22854.1 hypothetical protein JSQ81_04545 [Sporosarcina sp. Marseille-Q4063]